LECSILGPLEITEAGERRDLPGRRQRALVARLAIADGRPVTADRLIEDLWGGRRPAHPSTALQQLVLAVRGRLGAERVETVPGGYRLAVTDDDVDARVFERLATEARRALDAGRAEAALATLSEALACWRGDALAGLDEGWAREEATRLEELRAAAHEDRAEAALAVGRHAPLVAELTPLVAAHPLRERLRGQLVRALAASGRQADALAVYDEGRRLLADELGLDPSPQLRRIQAEVLAGGDAPVDGAAPTRTAGAFPADRSGAALPIVASSFVGREVDLRRLTDLLTTERLVTLTGPGGAGKTRLAVEAARQLQGGRPDRAIHLADLAVLRDGAAVAPAVAAALGASGSRDRRAVDALHAQLGGRDVLLVLDNCEHLLDEVADLAHDLLSRHPRLQVLATSRTPLGVTGEVVWPLPPLAVPRADLRARADLEATAAVQLFLDRARAAAADLDLDEADLTAVGAIVRELDGLPLAIELAAARVRALSVRDLADRLQDRLRILAGGRRGVPARHRTLRATIEWSWELLSDDERRAWMAASVAAAPFDAATFETLLAAAGCHLDAVDAVTALCDRSVLTVDDRGAPTRYRMLETLRAYGAEQLVAAGLDGRVRETHADIVERAVAGADRTTSRRWDVDIEEQQRWLPEARAALRWRLDRGDRLGAQRLAAALGWTWLLAGLAPEGLRWLDAGLGHIEQVEPDQVDAGAVLWAATVRLNEAPHDHGLRWAQLAVDVADDEVQRELARGTELAHRATAGDVAGALTALERLRTGGRPSAEEGWLLGYRLLLEGQLLALEGPTTTAEATLDRAERLLVGHGAWFGVWTAATLVQLAQARGDVTRVREVAARALGVCEDRQVAELEIELRGMLAMDGASVTPAGAPSTEAERQLELAARRAEETGVSMSRALVATAGAYLAWRRGDATAAVAACQLALATHDRAGLPFGRPFVRWILGHLAREAGDAAGAAEHLEASLAEAREREEGEAVARALEGLAAVRLDALETADEAATATGTAEARRLVREAADRRADRTGDGGGEETAIPVIGGAELRTLQARVTPGRRSPTHPAV
jgi:predicted ATPase/DNA-binding SARP family transcriptional activator